MSLQNLHTKEMFTLVRVDYVPNYRSSIKVWVLENSRGEESRWNKESMIVGFGSHPWLYLQ